MLRVFEYGRTGPPVVLLHGGPGAGGYLAPLARSLADSYHVLEPLQRGSGDEPLTVARHVADLDDLLQSRCAETRPVLVGHSWGAMLALAHAATHPARARAVALVGCGTFDAASRDLLRAAVDARTSRDLQQRLSRLALEVSDPDLRLRRLGELLLPLYSCDLTVGGIALETCDARAHRETWQDMLRLMAAGVYPAAFAAIRAPVSMLHGKDDPHPGRSTEAVLRPQLPQLEYHEWERCGHYPWLERSAAADFLLTLRGWLSRVTATALVSC